MKNIISSIISALIGAVVGAEVTKKNTRKVVEQTRNMSDKHLALFLLMNQWVKVKQEGKSLASYCEKNGYKKIAVYGMSYVGKTLLDELKNTKIQVVYGIDKNADSIYADVDIYTLNDNLESVDAVIVTAIAFFDEVEEVLSDKVQCPIISLEDIVYEV